LTITGIGDISIPISVEGEGKSSRVSCNGDVSLLPIEALSIGFITSIAEGGVELPNLSVQGTGPYHHEDEGAVELPLVKINGVGISGFVGTGDCTVPLVFVDGIASWRFDGMLIPITHVGNYQIILSHF